MAASNAFRLAKGAQRRQATLISRAKTDGMPPVIKPSLWEKAKDAYFGQRPLTRKELLQAQMAAIGDE